MYGHAVLLKWNQLTTPTERHFPNGYAESDSDTSCHVGNYSHTVTLAVSIEDVGIFVENSDKSSRDSHFNALGRNPLYELDLIYLLARPSLVFGW